MVSAEPAKKTVACITAKSSGWTPSSAGISGNTAAPSGTSPPGSCSSPATASASGHRGDDADLVAVLDRRRQAAQIADVLVVDEDVEELLELVAVVEAGGQLGVEVADVGQRLADGGAGGVDHGVAVGV